MTEPTMLRRVELDRGIKAIGGQALPDDDQLSTHVAELLDELGDAVSNADLREVPDQGMPAAADHENQRYYINYDANADVRDKPNPAAWKTASYLHEVMHISCDMKYRHPTGDRYQWLNFHTSDDNSEAEQAVDEQKAIATHNLEHLETVVDGDPLLPQPVKRMFLSGVNGRLAYSQNSPSDEYDTVILDMLIYLQLIGLTETATYRQLERMSRETRERRMADERVRLTRRF